MKYFERDGRFFRAEADDLMTMEIWNPYEKVWEPYLGDVALVVVEGNPRDKPLEVS